MKKDYKELSPKDIVKYLDRYIIGQEEAKKAVAIALRNRIRRMKIKDEFFRKEITPSNILMIGPTGVGKTEIARRIAKIANSPFIKVEATRYTEVGYVGRDVESIIRDLMEFAINQVKNQRLKEKEKEIKQRVDEILINKIIDKFFDRKILNESDLDNEIERIRKEYYEGKYENEDILINVKESNVQGAVIDVFGVYGSNEDITSGIQELLKDLFPKQKKKKRMSIKDAREYLIEEEKNKLLDKDSLIKEAKQAVEERGIVFIDEIDKIVGSYKEGPDNVSKEGVQQDFLPLLDGTTVYTKYGYISTDHILFIAAGAFATVKPSDLMPEFLGRFPIRVELSSLTDKDFEKILVIPENSLIKQYRKLLETENIEIEFTDGAIKEVAKVAYKLNQLLEDIGARRLQTVMSKLLEIEMFEFSELKEKKKVIIDKKEVHKRLNKLYDTINLETEKYIL